MSVNRIDLKLQLVLWKQLHILLGRMRGAGSQQKKMGGVSSDWKYGMCKKKGVFFVHDKKKNTRLVSTWRYVFPDSALPCNEKNGCFDRTTTLHLRLKKSKVEINASLKEALQNETLHDSTICRWHRAFKDGRESAEIEHVGGWTQCQWWLKMTVIYPFESWQMTYIFLECQLSTF